MNISDSEGESSCKRQENGDASSSDRPHKKARFAWQVKGKYHLKNDLTDSSKSCSSRYEPKQGSSSSKDKHREVLGHTEQNLERLGDYLLKQDFNTLDSVISDSDSSRLQPSPSISSDKLSYPKYVTLSDSISSSSSRGESNNEVNILIPTSMVVSQSMNEDQCIARWQARQVAQGFVDNTINRLLDSWMIAPLPAELDNRTLALDVAEFINNLPGDNSIENEGILMAISAHGLRNNMGSSSSNLAQHNDCHRNNLLSKDAFPSPPSSPTSSEDDNIELNKNHSNTDNSHEIEMWSCNEMKRTVDNSLTPLSLYPDNSSSSYHCFSENYPLDSVNLDNEVDNPSSENDFTSHFDFMDAAVSFAIQNKGLTSLGSDYG